LKEELDYLINVKRKEAAEKLRLAISFGDISENAAYEEAKESQGFLEGRILELKEILSNAELIGKTKAREVRVGSTVLISTDGKKERFQLVGSEEVDVLQGKISHMSPLGSALVGKTKGTMVDVKTLEGTVKYKIVEVS